MIAPLQESNTVAPERRSRLRETHQYLATALFSESAEPRGPAVTPWKAWVLVGWMVGTIALYAASMLGWW
jgi:hypothetical protein